MFSLLGMLLDGGMQGEVWEGGGKASADEAF